VKTKVSLALCLRQLLQFVESTQGHVSFDRFAVSTKEMHNCTAADDAGRFYGLCTPYACDKLWKNVTKSKAAHLSVEQCGETHHTVHNAHTEVTHTATVQHVHACIMPQTTYHISMCLQFDSLQASSIMPPTWYPNVGCCPTRFQPPVWHYHYLPNPPRPPTTLDLLCHNDARANVKIPCCQQKICLSLADVVSFSGMKTFSRRIGLLKELLNR